MRQPRIAAGNRTAAVTVLSISPKEDDHASLQSILRHTSWMLIQADSLAAAIGVLRQHDVSVVLCERDLEPGTWTDLLDSAKDLMRPPSVIVTSRLADERLWAEALNLGAWDVFPKPFDGMEVLRGIKVAWQHWYDQRPTPGALFTVAS